MEHRSVALLVTITSLGGLLLGLVLAWATLPWLNQSQVYPAIFSAALLLFGIGFVLNPLLKNYLTVPKSLAEEIQIIMTANPAHRVPTEGQSGMKDIVVAINAFANHHQEILESQAAQIEQSQLNLEDEKNRLAILISELTNGVVVCNAKGRILLYNNQARQLLEHVANDQAGGLAKAGSFVGLGRSIFGLIDRDAIIYTLDTLEHQRSTNNPDQTAQFVVTTSGKQLVRVRLTPVFTQQETMSGFILNLEDVTRQNETSDRQYNLLHGLTQNSRASIAHIETTIEAMKQTPPNDEAQHKRLQQAIYQETANLNTKLEEANTKYIAGLSLFDWRMEDIQGSDLLWAIQHAIEKQLGHACLTESLVEEVWLRVDSFSIVLIMAHIMERLHHSYGVDTFTLSLTPLEQLAALDLVWTDSKADMAVLRSWQDEPQSSSFSAVPVTIKQVTEAHNGDVAWQNDPSCNRIYFQLLLPISQPKSTQPIPIPVTSVSRPEFYDFDLFQQVEPTPELDQCPLLELTYTLFDTETTGLYPSQGDEIISIGAVRVVNGRLLHQEVFDHLVNPKRPMSSTSIEITGISPDMLEGQPSIEQVLPEFFEFARDTVLVAHNAAFDMRFLQLKEKVTGVKFTNPVLDTLLLSAVVHPHHNDHNLEIIAERLGINVMGRHTSLGDAMVTGEVFLKLISILAKRGIITLAQARQVARQTYLARISY